MKFGTDLSCVRLIQWDRWKVMNLLTVHCYFTLSMLLTRKDGLNYHMLQVTFVASFEKVCMCQS